MQIFWQTLFDRVQARDGVPPPGLALKTLAAALAVVYGLGARTRRALYAQGWLKTKRLPAPVISVGNLTVGGTGKTPVAACLARFFQARGCNVAILSRGYGGTARGVTRIADGSRIYARPPEVGEEPYWLARALPGGAVYTAPERYAAGLAAWQDCKPDLFLLDDGFQHFQLHRDLDVVLLDADAPFGNGRLLPRGPLREPVSTLAAAQVLILTRFHPHRHQDRLELLQEKFPAKTVLTAAILPTKVFMLPEGREMSLKSLKNQNLLAFAGLARPRVFYDTLRDLGVNLQGCRDFPDHYPFKPHDLDLLVTEAQSLGAAGLITTAKDWARLGEKWDYPMPLWVLEVEARLEAGGEKKIFEMLGEATGPGHRESACTTGDEPARAQGKCLPKFSPKGSLSPPFLKGDLGGFSAGYSNPLPGRGEPCVRPGAGRTQGSPLHVGGSDSQSRQAPASLSQDQPLALPLPPEVKQRFQQLQVKGKWRGDAARVRRILVRVPNWVGDAVMSLPALAAVHTLFPQAQITVLAAPRAAPLFMGFPGVTEIAPYPPGPEKWRTLWRLRRGRKNNGKRKTENGKPRFDLGLALPNSWEAALGLWLAGAKIRLGYDTQGRGPLLNVAVSGVDMLAGLHTVYYLLGVFQGLGRVDFFAPPRLYLQEEEVKAAAALLKDKQGQGPWVGLSPGAAFGPAKRWPPERFADLGKNLRQEFGARVVLLGGPEDRDAAGQVKERLPDALDLVGRTTLRQALGVLTLLQLLITNDSGLMHAAAALNTPLVAIFGSTDPVATGPFTDRAAVLHHPLPCSPCLQRTCARDYQCLLDITVPEVLDAARGWLKEGV